MDASILFRQILRLPPTHRNALLAPLRPSTRTLAHSPQQHLQRYISVPRIIQPSFWASMIPKPLRPNSSSDPSSPPRASKEWNPATPYIILGLLVGSQAIQILWLKQERGHEMRRAEAKISVLREVIERVQRGEKVDVEAVLGTGDAVKEEEWKSVLKDIQDEEALFQSKKKRKAMREKALREEEAAASNKGEEIVDRGKAKMEVESLGGVKFY